MLDEPQQMIVPQSATGGADKHTTPSLHPAQPAPAEPIGPPTQRVDLSPMMRRQRKALALASACAVLSTGGLIASTLIDSPAEVAATTLPPRPSVLTATIERRVLTSTLVTRGVVAAATQVTFSPFSPTQGASTQVVTGVRSSVGKQIRFGEVLLEISGRPLIVLSGPVPAYRDLKPTDEGKDVERLQKALASLGHYRGGDPRGRFGAATKQAVARLYGAIGYDVPNAGDPAGNRGRAELAGAEAAVDEARRQVDAIRRRMATGQPVAEGEEPLSDQLKYSKKALARAILARDDIVARTGPMMPMSEMMFVPGLPAQVAQLSAKVGEPVRTPLITLAAGELTISIKLSPSQAKLVKPNMVANIAAETFGEGLNGKVRSVGAVTSGELVEPSQPESSAANPAVPAPGLPYVPVVVESDSALPPAWAGHDVRVTISAAQTPRPVLVVPLSAVSAGADGRTTVSKVGSGQQITRIEVVTGPSGDGFVAVTAADGALNEGDKVVVGE